jgi:hypothetical protein
MLLQQSNFTLHADMTLCVFVTYVKNGKENLFICGSFNDAFSGLMNVVMINKSLERIWKERIVSAGLSKSTKNLNQGNKSRGPRI